MDIVSWDSQVARQFKLESIPHLLVYDKNGQMIASGDAAFAWLQKQ